MEGATELGGFDDAIEGSTEHVGFDGVIKASSGVRVPPQVRAGSRKVRTDLARKFATAASVDETLFSIVVVSVSSLVCCFLFLLWRFRRPLRLPGVSRLAVLVS